ncbi:MAG: TnsA endonuclease N-terminal domain-containing protein [Phycisphaerae bacterium]
MSPKKRQSKLKHPTNKRSRRRKGNRPEFTTERGIAKRWKEGRGKGEGRDYFPWFLVREFSSRGYRVMTMSAKFLRVIHLFSTLEWLVFLLLEADPDIISLKEQFPLDRDQTRAIAKMLKIKRHPRTYGTDVVVTTDFLVEVRTATGTVKWAIAVKWSKDLRDRRVVEKLQIEQAYHAARGTLFKIMTERDVPRELVKNLAIVRSMLRPGSMMDISDAAITAADAIMRPQLGRAVWGPMCVGCDVALQLKPGTSARIAKFQIASRSWAVDLTQPLMSRLPFRMLSQ